MRWVLPGGAVLSQGDERALALRPRAGVAQRTLAEATYPVRSAIRPPAVVAEVPPPPAATPTGVPEPPRPKPAERLATAKLFLEVLTILVGLIGTVLALFGLSGK